LTSTPKLEYMHDQMRVELNITELCNLTCDFCPRAHGYPNRNLHMSFEILDEFLNAHAEFVSTYKVSPSILLIGRGEPTLHGEFEQFIERIHSYTEATKKTFGLKTSTLIQTNGYKLDEWLPRVGDMIKYIIVNCYSNKTYTEYLELKERFAGSKHVAVQDRGTTGKNEIEDEVRVSPGGEVTPVKYNNRSGSLPEGIIPLVNIEDAYNQPCHKVFDTFYMDWDGEWRICCNDWGTPPESFGESFGNIKDTSLIEHMMINPKYNEYRWRLVHGDRSLNPCNKCNAVIPARVRESVENSMQFMIDNPPAWIPDHMPKKMKKHW